MPVIPGISVIISEEGLIYPSGKEVHPNNTVTFAVDRDSNGNVIGDFKLVFVSPICFTSPGPFILDADNPSVPVTVSSTAKSDTYWFDVERLNPTTIPSQDPRNQDLRKPPGWEVKRGEVDVSTDPDKKDAQKPS